MVVNWLCDHGCGTGDSPDRGGGDDDTSYSMF